MYTAGKTKIGRKYNKIVYKDSNTTIPGVTEGLTGCKIEKNSLFVEVVYPSNKSISKLIIVKCYNVPYTLRTL